MHVIRLVRTAVGLLLLRLALFVLPGDRRPAPVPAAAAPAAGSSAPRLPRHLRRQLAKRLAQQYTRAF